MCNCKDIEIGSHKNQVNLKNWWNGKVVSVDACMESEIVYLWDKGVITTGSCCGHNKKEPMINVIEGHHDKMVSLGYAYYLNTFNTLVYKPKLINIY